MSALNNITYNATAGIDRIPGPPGVNPLNHHLHAIRSTVDQYVFPFAVGFGIPMNIVSAVIFWHCRKLRKNTTTHYYIACCVFDTIMLLCVLLSELRVYEVDLYNKEGICQIVTYLTQLSSFLSHWCVCLAMFNVWVYCKCREFAQEVFTVFKTRTIIISLFILAGVSMLYLTWASGILIPSYLNMSKGLCTIILSNGNLVRNLWRTGDVFTYIIPSLCTMLLFLLTIRQIFCARRHGRTPNLLNNRYVSRPSKLIFFRTSVNSKNEPHIWTSLLIAIVFSATAFTLGVIKLRVSYLGGSPEAPYQALLQTITSKLFNIQYAWKCMVYFLACAKFRNYVLCRDKCATNLNLNSSSSTLNDNVAPTTL